MFATFCCSHVDNIHPYDMHGSNELIYYACRPVNGSKELKELTEDENTHEVPLLNDQVAMESRGVISEPLFTGIPVRTMLKCLLQSR